MVQECGETWLARGRTTQRRTIFSSASGLRAVAWAFALMLFCRPAQVLAQRGQDEDWYKVLGVARTAESAVIRTAYRKLVLKWHPDKNPGKEEASATMTARLNNAYEILMNSVQRRDFEERFFGAATPAPEAAARPASAPGSAPPANRGARPSAQGMGEHEQEEYGHAEGVDAEPTSSFDPRRPGKSWRAWGRGRGTTRGAHDAHAGPQVFVVHVCVRAYACAQSVCILCVCAYAPAGTCTRSHRTSTRVFHSTPAH